MGGGCVYFDFSSYIRIRKGENRNIVENSLAANISRIKPCVHSFTELIKKMYSQKTQNPAENLLVLSTPIQNFTAKFNKRIYANNLDGNKLNKFSNRGNRGPVAR